MLNPPPSPVTPAHSLDAERFHPRVDANFMVRTMIRGRLVITKATNLSMAGLFLLDTAATRGDRLSVSLPLPGTKEIVVSGRVTRVEPAGVALAFDALDWEELLVLARYLHPRLP